MYLNTKLEEFDGSINVAFIGCGKFISMFLSQYNHLKKIRIDTIIYDANNVLKEFHRDQEYHVNGKKCLLHELILNLIFSVLVFETYQIEKTFVCHLYKKSHLLYW